ncbi:hypothetical protein C8R44DRAFT_874051 [Mycena epipterygia]|nr:hypothetical protein C8R44DRAFT_874051 [Mycena epipterygia]
MSPWSETPSGQTDELRRPSHDAGDEPRGQSPHELLSAARCPRLEDAVLVSHCGQESAQRLSPGGGSRGAPREPRAVRPKKIRVAVLGADVEHPSKRRIRPRTRTRRHVFAESTRRMYIRRPHSANTDTTRPGLILAPDGAGIRPPMVVETSWKRTLLRGRRGQIMPPPATSMGVAPVEIVGRIADEASFIH